MSVIALSLSIIALKNLDIVGSANAIVQEKPNVIFDKSDAMIGEVRLFAGDFAPIGWEFCNGQTVKIEDYEPLYSILGFTYGGDEDDETFDLPDLRGKYAIGSGKSSTTDLYELGEEKDVFVRLNKPNDATLEKMRKESAANKAAMKGNGSSKSGIPSLSKNSVARNPNYQIKSGLLTMNYIICTEGILPE